MQAKQTNADRPFVERRKNTDRRASDRAPVVNTDVLRNHMERSLRNVLRSAVNEALHTGVEQALRESGAVVFNDANLTAHDTPRRRASDNVTPARRLRQLDPSAEPAVIRNGVRCPDFDSVTGKLWLLYGKAGAGVTLTQARELALANGLNPTSASIALYNWRKFHNVPNPRG